MPQVKTLRLICIRGGPITQLEEKTIRTVVKETKEDLQAKEVEADIEVVTLDFSHHVYCQRKGCEMNPSFGSNEDGTRLFCKEHKHDGHVDVSHKTSFEEMYLQPWSCQAIAREVSRFLRSACTHDTTPASESKANASADETKSSASAALPLRTNSNPMMEAEGWDEDPKRNVV
jgi:hypothetical protein